MPQYMLSVWHDPANPVPDDPEVIQKAFKQVDAFNAEITAQGKWVFGGGLCGPESATVVRDVDGETVITDGMFAETKEFLGGYWIIEAADLDEALAWAAKGAAACMGPVEVRPFQDEPES